ncbi:metal ion binding oxidoreductase [Pyrrhoderma noxium]|uniref:Metal ion binding oxidoreductase n=1 Tax=Pyrrhoderma noxium TaxID=2282107 RepID=A0A286U9E0_9AGAM|nr:metal ion binding oxidoreductase [Pyrrhoderma noxium]
MSSPYQARLSSSLLGHRSSSPHSKASSPALSSSSISLPRPSSTERSRSSGIPHLDQAPQLQRAVHTIVKSRAGSVLSRGFILKTDHYPSGRALDLELNVHGAPNFRAPRFGNLNVFGAAQPRSQGLRAILSVLKCRPGVSDPHACVWFSTREEPIVYISGRSFVLRDASEPRKTLPMSDRAENLEDIEKRLKNDILQESVKFGGLILTHNEVATDGAIMPTWTAVDANNVKTSRELWESMKKDGWRVEYYRIPISPDRPIEDNYLDAYVQVIKETDPTKTSLVFSCGMGAVRTTFAMVAALLVRRKQLVARGLGDPFTVKGPNSSSNSGYSTPTNSQVMLSFEQANAQQELSKSLLRLTATLQQSLQSQYAVSAVELLLADPALMDNLRKAHMGNYGVILSLLGCLDHGATAKRLADRVIDACDHVVSLREEIFTNRIRYSTTSLDEQSREAFLDKAVKSLEKYFFIIAFASYVEERGSSGFEESFSQWMRARSEIWNQVAFLRKSHGSRLNVFSPIQDLSSLSKGGAEGLQVIAGPKHDITVAGGQVLGDEYTDHVVKTRSGVILREGTLLKSDQWLIEAHDLGQGVRGASNFRNVAGTSIYALGQPSTDAIDEVVRRVKDEHPGAEHIAWITLREEPVVYINGAPYCLRREGFTLRNMKDYGGISASRLEILEERLRDDVRTELDKFGGRLLLHTEAHDGTVIPIWEEVGPEAVEAMREIMVQRSQMPDGTRVLYKRIPITSERPPDFTDLSDMMEVVTRLHSSNTPIILNCQLGRGRSTVASIIILLIQQWLQAQRRPRLARSPSTYMRRTNSILDIGLAQNDPNRHSYQVINNLLRVIRNGLMVKDAVDAAIDQCSDVYNLRDSIEDSRMRAEQASNDQTRKSYAQRGLYNLRRYFELIIFQWYLSTIEPDTIRTVESFESFVKNHPVIKTFEKDLQAEGLNALKPLERVDLAEGVALPDEARQVVMSRKGSILSASTILKSDFFSNLQKMSLPERVEGSPNFRRVPLLVELNSAPGLNGNIFRGKRVCGSGMPTVQGLRRALARVNADPSGNNMVFWTSLREEPVLYVAGRPHVLRLMDRPLENVEATGVTTQTVEVMEKNLKRDVIREVIANEGRILLHDEVEERPGVFSIVAQWENVDTDDILTPRDVFDLMAKEGFKINYDRIAITDEQAPLPDALYHLFERVESGLKHNEAGDFIFNCQMGRGRTTTGMVSACLVATISAYNGRIEELVVSNEPDGEEPPYYDPLDGPSEEEVYLQGEYKIILQLVGVLSHGKIAKTLADRAIDLMQDVQNLRKAIYDYKLKIEALPKGSDKQKKLMNLGVNYLYRYGTLIVFANYLIELKECSGDGSGRSMASFPAWLKERREITTILGRRTLA